MVYLDNAATTYPKPERVYSVMDDVNRNMSFNSGRGVYRVASECAKLVDETKKGLLSLVHGTGCETVVFTPSVTIAINEIINGLRIKSGDFIYVSPYEHNAVARTVKRVCDLCGARLEELPVKKDTLEIDLEKAKYAFSIKPPICVCCTAISNVTGYILPFDEVFELAGQYKAICILDSAQALGLIDIDVIKSNADFIAFAGHKSLYGPFGIGGFIDVKGIELNPFIVGGTGSDSLNLDMPGESPYRYESASGNIVAIAGLKAAIEDLNINENPTEKELLENLIDNLKKNDRVVMYLPPEDRRIGILSINVKGYKAEDVGMILDQDYDIAVRTGYHCAPFIHEYLNDVSYLGTVRIGIGRYNTKDDIDSLVTAMREICE